MTAESKLVGGRAPPVEEISSAENLASDITTRVRVRVREVLRLILQIQRGKMRPVV